MLSPMVRWILLLTAVLVASACGPRATEGGFDSANPAARSYAIEQAALAGDRSAIPAIVEQLDSDDPLVRMLAIDALERLTGETFGYRANQPRHLREPAVRRWVHAVQTQTVPFPADEEHTGWAEPAPANADE